MGFLRANGTNYSNKLNRFRMTTRRRHNNFIIIVCLSTVHLTSATTARSTNVRVFRIELKFGSVGFCGEGKPENPEKNLSKQ